MTATITLMNGKTIFVREIISLTHVGTHTYEFHTKDGGKLRIVEVVHIIISYMCECHNQLELVEYCSKCGADTANPCGCIAD